jgi:hypothetical protein
VRDRKKEFEEFLQMCIGKDNPFEDAYVKREVRWYNKEDFQQNGIRVHNAVPQGELDDYLNRNYRIDPELRVPMLFIDGELWMSLTPMEIQSQFLAIVNASGDVGVAGLGMGYAALKMAQNHHVQTVTVFEIDERIVKFFKRAFRRRKGFDKIRFVIGDARETIPEHDELFDWLYVDIYQTLLPDEVLTDIELFQQSVHVFPDCYHFWGQERVLVDGALGYGLIDGRDLPMSLRAYLTRWQKTPVSTDPRLADTMLSDMYRVQADQEYCEDVLRALGMYE